MLRIAAAADDDDVSTRGVEGLSRYQSFTLTTAINSPERSFPNTAICLWKVVKTRKNEEFSSLETDAHNSVDNQGCEPKMKIARVGFLFFHRHCRSVSVGTKKNHQETKPKPNTSWSVSR